MIEKTLETHATKYGISLTPEQLRQFALYAGLLLDWNTRMNLTAITQPEEIVVKHFLDSLLLLKHAGLPDGESVIDVGTGAGFPGLPLKIARPDLRLTLLDSSAKRTGFLQEVANALGLEVVTIHGRAEEQGQKPEHRERYLLVTARAVAVLPVLCEYCLPFAKPGGVFAALKGPGIQAEAEDAKAAIKKLGGLLTAIEEYELPNGNRRTIVLVQKISQTPAGYPRTHAKIAKRPL
jgi:16S rRNA (guanine(527)-N(7))-methyltransferase RsmG